MTRPDLPILSFATAADLDQWMSGHGIEKYAAMMAEGQKIHP